MPHIYCMIEEEVQYKRKEGSCYNILEWQANIKNTYNTPKEG